MTTFADMVGKIAGDMQRGDLTSNIETAVNRAIRYYYDSTDFYFNETRDNFATVKGQKIYTQANVGFSNIAEILLVKIEINTSTDIELMFRTFQYIEKMDINNTQGQPFDYAYYDQSFYIYPVPDAAYTVTVFYNQEYVALTGAQENAFTIDAEDLIEARARWLLYTHVIQNNDAAQAAKAEEKDALQALRISTARKASTGKVRPIQF